MPDAHRAGSAKIAGEAALVLCRVNFLMGQRGVIAFGIPERLDEWHLHPVNAFGIERPVAAMANLDAGSSKEGLRIRMRCTGSRIASAGRVYCSGNPSICSTLKTVYPFMKGISRSTSSPLASSASLR